MLLNVIQKNNKQQQNWCLADYVSELDIVYPKEDEDNQPISNTNDDLKFETKMMKMN